MNEFATARAVHADDPRLADAVRETVLRQVVDLLERNGLDPSPDLVACPRCGERVIVLDLPRTFSIDHASATAICAPCAAEEQVGMLERVDVDLGGEG